MKKKKENILLVDKVGRKTKERVKAKKIQKFTNGLFSNIMDFALYYFLLFPISTIGRTKGPADIFQASVKAELLSYQVNFKQLKNAYRKLREKGLITSIKEWQDRQIATNEGIKRLKNLIPFYDEERFWDGNLYLVQYDIPIRQNQIRDRLRDWFLKRLGAVALQKSSYLLFNDPSDLIKSFLDNCSDFEGSILISRLKKDGILGKGQLEKYIWRKSGLDKVNIQYSNFITEYKNEKKINKINMYNDYFSILKEDPQIPFALMPDEYIGDEAYLLFLKHFKDTLFYKHMRWE